MLVRGQIRCRFSYSAMNHPFMALPRFRGLQIAASPIFGVVSPFRASVDDFRTDFREQTASTFYQLILGPHDVVFNMQFLARSRA